MNLKEKILNIINSKHILNKFKFSEDEISEIFSKTYYLNDVSFSERIYCFINDFKRKPHCKNCNKDVKFLRISSGYRPFCSCKCKNIYINKNTDICKRISEGVLQYHYSLPKEERRKQQNKRIKTMVENNQIIDPKNKSLFEIYKSEVSKVTNSQNISSLKNYEKRGRIELNGYHLDHIFSVQNGFLNNIPPYIIGNITNLRFISGFENCSKKERSDKTIEELFFDFFESSTTIPKGSRIK